MTRILADLPDEDIRWLDERAAEQRRSRAAVLRDAVAAYRADTEHDNLSWLDAGVGLWARSGMVHDTDEYEHERRAEWTRPWDEDFDEVRTQAPSHFDEEDDRQRQIYLAMLAGRYPSPRKPTSP